MTLSPIAIPPVAVTPCAAPPAKDRLVVSIEGNIGIGKSTLLANLRKRYANDPRVAFVDEPVELWEANDLLGAMYRNELSRSSFQFMALTTRYTALLNSFNSEASIIITERSFLSDRYCFAAVNLESQADILAYAVTHDALVDSLPTDLRMGTVLLTAPRSVCAHRPHPTPGINQHV